MPQRQLDDRIRASLAAQVTLVLNDAERRRHRPWRLWTGGHCVTAQETAVIRAIHAPKTMFYRTRTGDLLLARHRDYADLWYVLNGHCRSCQGSIAKGDDHQAECAVCGGQLGEFEIEEGEA